MATNQKCASLTSSTWIVIGSALVLLEHALVKFTGSSAGQVKMFGIQKALNPNPMVVKYKKILVIYLDLWRITTAAKCNKMVWEAC